MLLFDHILLPSAKKITKIIQLTSSPSAGSSQTVKCTSLLSPALQRAERCPNPLRQQSARKASRSARQLLKGVKNPRGLRPGLCGQDCACPPASAATFPRKEKSRVPVQPPCSTRPPHGRAPRRSRSAAHNGKLRASRSQGNRQGNRRRSQPFTRGSRGQNPTFSKGEALDPDSCPLVPQSTAASSQPSAEANTDFRHANPGNSVMTRLTRHFLGFLSTCSQAHSQGNLGVT